MNARDAGLTLQLTTAGHSDAVLVRIPLTSPDARAALTELTKPLQMPPPRFAGNSLSEVYAAEKTLLQSHRITPLLHLRNGAASRANVRNFNILPDGTWQLNDAWLTTEKP